MSCSDDSVFRCCRTSASCESQNPHPVAQNATRVGHPGFKTVMRQLLLVTGWLVLGVGGLFAAEKPAKTVYDYALVDLNGKEVSLSAYKGKVLVIVNLASQSIFHEQNRDA